MTVNGDEDRREIGVGFSLQPVIPNEIKFNLVYKGRSLSFLVQPNELKIIEYNKFILMVRYIKNSEEDKLKWVTLGNHGNLIDEGEV